MEYYSAITKNETMPFVSTWMDLEIIILSEISQRTRDKCLMTSPRPYGISNVTQTNLSMKQTHRHREQTCGRMDWEFGMSRWKPLYRENNK